MISIKIWETPLSCHAKCSLPVAVRVSKTLVLKLPIILNNYWMRLIMISWIIKTEVCVKPKPKAEADNTDLGFDNSWYHAKTEFNNCFIIHFLNNRRKKTFICWKMRWGEHSKGLSNQADVELDMINVISAADITFIMSSSQAIVNWLNESCEWPVTRCE